MTKRLVLISIAMFALTALGLYKAFNEGEIDQPWDLQSPMLSQWVDQDVDFPSMQILQLIPQFSHLTLDLELNNSFSSSPTATQEMGSINTKIGDVNENPIESSAEVRFIAHKSRLPDSL